MNQSLTISDDLKREVSAQIVAFFKTEIVNDPTFDITEHDEIIAMGLIDSMGIVRLLTHLQKLYSVRQFEKRDMILDNFRSIDRISSMVCRYI